MNEEKESNGLTVKTNEYFGGLHWVYIDKFGNSLSIVCHNGSYGHESGLFEIMPSWKQPTKGDDVLGWLNFGEVQKWINKLTKLTKKVNKK